MISPSLLQPQMSVVVFSFFSFFSCLRLRVSCDLANFTMAPKPTTRDSPTEIWQLHYRRKATPISGTVSYLLSCFHWNSGSVSWDPEVVGGKSALLVKYVDKEPLGQSELCFTNLNQNGLSIIFLQLAGLQPKSGYTATLPQSYLSCPCFGYLE